MDVAATDIDYQRLARGWKPERCDRIALVLQGGGARGAYQAGVFQALSEADIEPDWVTGVSIEAINCAIIAGNSKQWRLKRLRTFWERITERKIWNYTPDGDVAPWRRLMKSTGPGGPRIFPRTIKHDILLSLTATIFHTGDGGRS